MEQKEVERKEKESNYLTFDNNQFMMEWPYKKNWTFILFFLSVLVLLDCLACCLVCIILNVDRWLPFYANLFFLLFPSFSLPLCAFSILPEIKCSCYLCYWPIYRHLFSALCLLVAFFYSSLSLFLFTWREREMA